MGEITWVGFLDRLQAFHSMKRRQYGDSCMGRGSISLLMNIERKMDRAMHGLDSTIPDDEWARENFDSILDLFAYTAIAHCWAGHGDQDRAIEAAVMMIHGSPASDIVPWSYPPMYENTQGSVLVLLRKVGEYADNEYESWQKFSERRSNENYKPMTILAYMALLRVFQSLTEEDYRGSEIARSTLD